MKIICIIAAYNEEKKIANTLDDVKKYLDNIVVVDDGSRDNTVKVAREKGVTVIEHKINRGQGAALETGNTYALKHQADIVVHFDADGQFLAKEIKDIIKPIKAGYDVTFGSRFLDKKSQVPFTKRNIIMPLAKLINLVFFNVRTSDPQNGFRALNVKALETIKIENDRMAHCSEILAKTRKYKLKYKEIPVTVLYAEFGQKFNSGFKILSDLFVNKLTK